MDSSGRFGWGYGHQPGLDCISNGHIMVENIELGAFPTEPDQLPQARWCLWCGGGISNEKLLDG